MQDSHCEQQNLVKYKIILKSVFDAFPAK